MLLPSDRLTAVISGTRVWSYFKKGLDITKGRMTESKKAVNICDTPPDYMAPGDA